MGRGICIRELLVLQLPTFRLVSTLYTTFSKISKEKLFQEPPRRSLDQRNHLLAEYCRRFRSEMISCQDSTPPPMKLVSQSRSSLLALHFGDRAGFSRVSPNTWEKHMRCPLFYPRYWTIV